ncbi:MAG: xanthine dehydrogenase family protein subunit M, partial [Alphaproteobacteria bacterium]|nr:xanthine dehydrogenase family protein subunit M [Alphaproteobacteria bacterium]
MKPPAFDYAAPASIAEAVQLLASHRGEAKLIAGGQSLMPMLNFRLLDPALLVDISRLPDLAQITASGRGITVGAGVCHHAL